MAQSIDTTSTTVHITLEGASLPLNVTVGRTPDFDYLVGDVDGTAFRVKGANLQTAQRERLAALRRAAAWQAIIDAGLAR